jgi:hypothetical protein
MQMGSFSSEFVGTATLHSFSEFDGNKDLVCGFPQSSNSNHLPSKTVTLVLKPIRLTPTRRVHLGPSFSPLYLVCTLHAMQKRRHLQRGFQMGIQILPKIPIRVRYHFVASYRYFFLLFDSVYRPAEQEGRGGRATKLLRRGPGCSRYPGRAPTR